MKLAGCKPIKLYIIGFSNVKSFPIVVLRGLVLKALIHPSVSSLQSETLFNVKDIGPGDQCP